MGCLAVRATDKALDAVDTASDIGKATGKLDDAADLVGNMKKNVCSNGACFVAGTLIETEYGSVQIEDIKVGTLVYAHNPETGETELKEVIDAFVKKTYQLIHIDVNGERITTTPEHPFWIPQKGWTDAVSLRAGDRLQLLNGEYVIIEQIQHEILENPLTVYNFEVEDFHTYYITSSEILVHNADCGDISKLSKKQVNAIKNKIVSGEDFTFSSKDEAVGFVQNNFSDFPKENAQSRSAQGWHFDAHIYKGVYREHINIYNKKMRFRSHIFWE